MIKKELYEIRDDGIKLYRTYSDEEYKIQQVETGNVYDEAIDVENAEFTYIETAEMIEKQYILEEGKDSNEKIIDPEE